jgi:hypothetical protein
MRTPLRGSHLAMHRTSLAMGAFYLVLGFFLGVLLSSLTTSLLSGLAVLS